MSTKITLHCEVCDTYIELDSDNDVDTFTCMNKVYCPITETLDNDESYDELDFNE